MADTLPINFPNAIPGAITSFDYFDLISGRAYKTFYPIHHLSATSLITTLIDSREAGTSTTAGIVTPANIMGSFFMFTNSNNGETVIDQDYDIEFKRTLTIEGEATCNFTSGFNVGSGSSWTGCNFKFIISHWDGTTETELDSVTEQINPLGSNGKFGIRCHFKFDLPKTKFKRGETLRLTTQVITNGTQNADEDVGIFTDPNNRPPRSGKTNMFIVYDGSSRTDFTLNIPFIPIE